MPPRPCFCPVAHCDACVCVRPVLRPIVCPIWWPILCPILCPFLGRGRLSIRSCVRLCARFCVRFCVRFVSDFVPDFVSDFSGGSKIRFLVGRTDHRRSVRNNVRNRVPRDVRPMVRYLPDFLSDFPPPDFFMRLQSDKNGKNRTQNRARLRRCSGTSASVFPATLAQTPRRALSSNRLRPDSPDLLDACAGAGTAAHIQFLHGLRFRVGGEKGVVECRI